jgi:hypothetical protein
VVDKSEKFITLVRVGYAARGLVYLLLGYIALSTGGEAEAGGKAVFDWLQDVPLGTIVLWVMALGLVAYAAFKFISAIADVQRHGSDKKGLVTRVGEFASGCAYSFLAYACFQFATGAKSSASGEEGSQQMAGTVLSASLGPVVIGLIGLGFFVGAFMQAKGAATASFMHRVSGRAPTGIEAVGRAGYAARAVVFAIIGWSLVKSAWFSQSSEIKGLGQALLSLRDTGPLYTVVAIGLVLFGLFSLVIARYRIIPDFDKRELKPKLGS